MILDTSSSTELVATARSLVSEARSAGRLDQNASVELGRATAALVATAFVAQDTPSQPPMAVSAPEVEAVLSLIEEMTADAGNTTLCEAGVRVSALVLRSIPVASAQVFSSQEGADRATLCCAHAVDVCLASLARICDDTASRLEKALLPGKPKGKHKPPSDSNGGDDAIERTHLALAIVECTSECLDYMCGGSDSPLLRSADIWKSTLEQCRPVAVYLSKLFAGACRLFTLSTTVQAAAQNPGVQPQQRLTLFKRCSKVIESISAVFGSEAHLRADDVGMKRSLMERFCEHALAAHKALLSAPPSLKAVLVALCAICTKFSAASFDNARQCQRVVVRCAGTVRELAVQLATTLLPRLRQANGMQDPKTGKRVKGNLMVIRFVVFRITALLPRARDHDARTAALAMLDVLFGDLLSAKTLLQLPDDVSSSVASLLSAVSRRFALSLLTSNAFVLTKYLDSLAVPLGTRSSAGTECNGGGSMPLLDGLSRVEAHCEMIRIACCELASFSPEDQTRLLGHRHSILASFAAAMDRDPLSALLPATGDSYTDGGNDKQQKEYSSYQQLVASVAASARCLASADTFGLWETGVLGEALDGAGRSLGCKVLLEAWVLLTRTGAAVDPTAAEAMVGGLVSALFQDRDSLCIDDGKTGTVSTILLTLMQGLSSQALRTCFQSAIDCPALRGIPDSSRLALIRILPWDLFGSEDADMKHRALVAAVAEDVLRCIVSQSPGARGGLLDYAGAFAAFEAMMPAVRVLEPQRRTKLVETMYTHACAAIEECISADCSTQTQAAATVVLSVAVACIEDSGNAGVGRILSLCARNIEHLLFQAERPMALLACLAGSYAVSRSVSPTTLASSMASLQAIVAHSLSDARPWIAQHEMLVHIFKAASDAGRDETLVQSLVENGGEDRLVGFIGRQAGGKATDDVEARGTVYSRILSDRPASLCAAATATNVAAGSGEKSVADMIASMKWLAAELKANAHRAAAATTGHSVQAFRSSFNALYSQMDRVSRDI
ncbi:hypothetical protein LPJ72_003772 [Coemansia sp. Benny D160-2]|nr:hypothetical protein LPJ72_003772 [Coemansia sp. Benny D160-2]